MTQRKLIAGNWKMHGLRASLSELDAIVAGLPDGVDVSVHPAAHIARAFRRPRGASG